MCFIEEERGCLDTSFGVDSLFCPSVLVIGAPLGMIVGGNATVDVLGAESGTYYANMWAIFKMVFLVVWSKYLNLEAGFDTLNDLVGLKGR